MSDPALLPTEIFEHITGYIGDDQTPADDNENASVTRSKFLLGCCCLSQKWYPHMIRQLYSRFDHTTHSFARIWKFLRTISSRPDLAPLVKHLRISQSTHPKKNKAERAQQDDHTDEWVLQQLKPYVGIAANIEINESALLDAYRKKQARPFLMVLMTCLPNLQILENAVDFPLPNLLKFDDLIFRHPEALSKLVEANVHLAPFRYDASVPRFQNSSACITSVAPFFTLPSMRQVIFHSVDFECWSHYRHHRTHCVHPSKGLQCAGCQHTEHYQIQKASSSVSDLTITLSRDSDNSGLLAFLEAPRALVSLSIGFPKRQSTFTNSHEILNNHTLWNALYEYRNTLEYLDIFRSDMPVLWDAAPPLPPLHSFQEYTKLKTLRVDPHQFMTLADRTYRRGTIALRFNIQGSVPASLVNLTLYTDNITEIETNVQSFYEGLQPLLDVETCPLMETIVLSTQLDRMGQTFRQGTNRNVKIYSVNRGLCPNGGLNVWKGPENRDVEAFVKNADYAAVNSQVVLRFAVSGEEEG